MAGTRFQNAIQIGTSAFMALAAATMLYVSGNAEFTGTVTLQSIVNASGASIPFSEDIVFTEESAWSAAVSKGGSGVFVITNPVNYDILCSNLTVDTTTAHSIYADVFYSSGVTIATGGATGTTIANNFSFDGVATTTLTGGSLSFKLKAANATGDGYKSIIFSTLSGTSVNASDFATVNADCNRIK